MANKKPNKTPRSASGRRAAPRSAGAALGDAEKKTAAQRAELAAARCVQWLQLYARLDEIQVDAETYFASKPFPKDQMRLSTILLFGGDRDRAFNHRLLLGFDLDQLEKRFPVFGPEIVGDREREAVSDLLIRVVGARPRRPDRSAAEAVAEAMRVARIAAEVDGKLAHVFEPMPDPFALDVLRRLARQPGRTAKEIAVEIVGNRQDQCDVRKVERAIDRLRKLGFELFNPSRGGGYLPTAADLARLERIDAPGRGT